jgi:hypothetical protein
MNAEFIAPEDALPVLRRAALVIDTSLDDPSTAIALAQRGVAVVAAVTSMMLDRWPMTGDYELFIRLSRQTDFVHGLRYRRDGRPRRPHECRTAQRGIEHPRTCRHARVLLSTGPPGSRSAATRDGRRTGPSPRADGNVFRGVHNLTQPVVEDI